jgi:hypothetical protein
VAEEWKPTPAESRIVNPLGIVLAIVNFATLVVGNVTGNWWPAYGSLVFVVFVAVGMTVWAARTRQQGVILTALQILRSPGPE